MPDMNDTPYLSNLNTSEKEKLAEHKNGTKLWKRWGPYLSERQWGTVREDYGSHGDAWDYLPHEHARSRAYRWGEDGLGGFSDHRQRLCFGLALWNGNDPILKERLFGLTNNEGNHGEDVKELYYYLDATPSHSYLKMLYKYPQGAFPYASLVEKNRGRNKALPEYEITDTGIFEENRYFDVYIEYGQIAPGEILMQITVHNRAEKAHDITVMPQMWYRNTWAWDKEAEKPVLQLTKEHGIKSQNEDLGENYWYLDNPDEIVFADNATNIHQHPQCTVKSTYYKDAFHQYVVNKNLAAVNPENAGTKSAGIWKSTVEGKGTKVFRTRFSAHQLDKPFDDFSQILSRLNENADAYYDTLQHDISQDDAKTVQRQALAGMIWSKQFYHFSVRQWLEGDSTQPPPERAKRRNEDWPYLYNEDVISMPDKWEYPWYAAWDLAFHCLPLAMLDSDFAKDQLTLLTREWYMHPNGQLPAYEWNFGDVNPPVHAWACWRVYQIDRKNNGKGDIDFLERVFHKLMINFTWWINRKDTEGNNIFQGGFLGLDNIGVFDRSRPLPTGGYLNQADGTSWMAMYSLNLLRISIELALHNDNYEDVASKFFEHFLHIAEAMTHIGGETSGLWDKEDKFFYDQLQLPDGQLIPLKLRSMVGLIPLYAVEVFDEQVLDKLPGFKRRMDWYLTNRPELNSLVYGWQNRGTKSRHLLSLVDEKRLRQILERMLDETEFLSPFGIRSLSKSHKAEPYSFQYHDINIQVGYESSESQSYLFGGNSNWRGPIWFPVNYLLIESLQKFHHYFGDSFKVECPTGSGNLMNLCQVADEISKRLSHLFLENAEGKRAIFEDYPFLQNDPLCKDNILFYEYFDGDTGRGLGASHQTGWTGVIAKLLQPRNDNH